MNGPPATTCRRERSTRPPQSGASSPASPCVRGMKSASKACPMADVTAEFRRAALAADVIWKPLCDAAGRPNEDEQEYAEVAFVPTWIGNGRKDAPEYRFVAIREPLRQLDLPHVTAPLPFPTQEFGTAGRYKLFGLVTNRLTMPGDALIRWHRERCGMSEKAHAVMKDDLAGVKMPSALFGVNPALWAIMIVARNL